EAFDQLVHLQAGRVAIRQQLAVLLGGARLAEGHFNGREQGRQRSTQLVRDIGGGLLLACERPLEQIQGLGQTFPDRTQLPWQALFFERQPEVLDRDATESQRQSLERRKSESDQPNAARYRGRESSQPNQE